MALIGSIQRPATAETSGSSDIRGSDGVEESPVGFAGVEQRSDPVVVESSETQCGAFDSLTRLLTVRRAICDSFNRWSSGRCR